MSYTRGPNEGMHAVAIETQKDQGKITAIYGFEMARSAENFRFRPGIKGILQQNIIVPLPVSLVPYVFLSPFSLIFSGLSPSSLIFSSSSPFSLIACHPPL